MSVDPGDLWQLFRSQPAKLSTGDLKSYQQGDGQLFTLRHQSPQPRVVRVVYQGFEWRNRNVFLVNASVRCYVDSASTEQTLLVPWQGFAWSVPAGMTEVSVTTEGGIEVGAGPGRNGGTIAVSISGSVSAFAFRQGEQQPNLPLVSDWYTLAAAAQQLVIPPPFATSMIVNVFAGDLTFTDGLGNVLPIGLGQYSDIPLSIPGFVLATGGVNGATFTTSWKVSQ